jgi:hypothetical protein
MYQQHPDFLGASVFLNVVPGFPLAGCPFVGLPCTFDLISFDNVVNAF